MPTIAPKNPFNSWGVGKHGFASSSATIDKTGIYVFYGATGNQRWRFFAEGPVRCAPVVSQGKPDGGNEFVFTLSY